MKAVIKVDLAGIDEPVAWRRIVVPEQFSFHQLHLVIQEAMGWRDAHLYRFAEDAFGSLIAITSPYDEEGGIDARSVPVGNILLRVHDTGYMSNPRKTLSYLYDYGDSWEHSSMLKTSSLKTGSGQNSLMSRCLSS